MHPYEMLHTLRDRHEDVTAPVSIGSLYNAVARLAEKGYVRPLKAEHVGNRPERTTYEILDTGRETMRERLMELLAVPTRLPQADHAGIGELHNLTPTEVLACLKTRIAELDTQLARYEGQLAQARNRNVPDIYLLYGSYLTSQQRHEREWVSALRDRIQEGQLTWPNQH